MPKIPPPQDYNAPKTYLHKMKPKTYSTKKEDYIMKPTKTEDTFVPEYYNNLQVSSFACLYVVADSFSTRLRLKFQLF